MITDKTELLRVLEEAIAKSNGRLRRVALCSAGAPPLIVDAHPLGRKKGYDLWDGVIELLRDEDVASINPDGHGVTVARVGPGLKLVGELDRQSNMGVVAVLLRETAALIDKKS